jgi:hypothetical protein
MDVVAVLRDGDTREPFVGGEPREPEALDMEVGHLDGDRVDVAVDLLRGTPVLRDIEGEPVPIRDDAHDDVSPDGEPVRPAARRSGQQLPRLAALEGLG